MSILPLESSIIYGPIRSRRLGISLGVNVLPVDRKVCSFDCVYCHYGRTDEKTRAPTVAGFPNVDAVLKAVAAALRRYPQIDAITLSGNGEPTLHPYFDALVMDLSHLRDTRCPDAKLALFSNATQVGVPRVRQALTKLDLPMMKLDAGDPETFARINRPAPGITLSAIVDGLRQLPNCTIQSVLIDGKTSNARGAPFAAWMETLVAIQPSRVQIYSTDYPVPEGGVKRVPPYILKRLASEVETRTGIPVQGYWIA